NEVPDEYSAFRNKVKECDALLFVTPEYNRSVAGVLKNALDVGARPKTDSVWNNKPAAIISMWSSRVSGFAANHHFRQSLAFFYMPVLQQPEAFLANVATLLDENGKINNDDTVNFLQSLVDGFVSLIKQNSL